MVARSEQPDEEEREGDTQNEHDIGDKARVFEEQARRCHARRRLLFWRPRLEACLCTRYLGSMPQESLVLGLGLRRLPVC